MSRPNKKKAHVTLWYTILGIELIITTASFLFGPQGLRDLHNLKHEKNTLQQSINSATANIKQLQIRITQWHNSTFYREQLAREQLQMAYADEIVYYVTK
jgi:cell division protein FtsB